MWSWICVFSSDISRLSATKSVSGGRYVCELRHDKVCVRMRVMTVPWSVPEGGVLVEGCVIITKSINFPHTRLLLIIHISQPYYAWNTKHFTLWGLKFSFLQYRSSPYTCMKGVTHSTYSMAAWPESPLLLITPNYITQVHGFSFSLHARTDPQNYHTLELHIEVKTLWIPLPPLSSSIFSKT